MSRFEKQPKFGIVTQIAAISDRLQPILAGMEKPTREKGPEWAGKEEKDSKKTYLEASFFLPSADLSPFFGMTQNLSSG